MTRLIPVLAWKLEGAAAETLDDRLLPLLAAVATTSSLTAAVGRCGVSYRAAWGLLRDCQREFGEPLVRLERGRGAHLAPAGERLLAAHHAAQQQLAPLIAGLEVEIGSARSGREPAMLQLQLAASHDVVLAALASSVPPLLEGLQIQVTFMGSLHALKEFGEARVAIAGFHVPLPDRLQWDRLPFLRWLQPRRHRLLRFVDRDQGLILPRGNPAQVRHFRDIAERGLRFVNRQPGSGTRLLIDQLLREAHIAPATVKGYPREEFTHPAVAATVASGGADAGFGLRAAAAEFDLAFVPLVRERYYLAFLARDAASPPITALARLLQGPAYAKLVRCFPGYYPAGSGEIVSVDALAGD